MPIMKIGSSEATGVEYAVRCEKLAQNVMKQEGEAAVKLIEQARPVGPNGEGSLINTTA